MQTNKYCKVPMFLSEEGLILPERVNKGLWHWYIAQIDPRGQNSKQWDQFVNYCNNLGEIWRSELEVRVLKMDPKDR